MQCWNARASVKWDVCSLWGVLHAVVFNTFLLLTVIAHSRAMLTDPGIVAINAAK